ncbi:hepatoma-derived growth factor-related protein 2 [Eurytemora carolleeae]|uniref:hepatoma-derived growth factor-related protein 2 n=1 Tax=Eurytemora carolleeae TaxID=1294199 RepID=UPI000C7931A1|nr:hepatoma-derived growth factor-related protein 2 [Eurytemora carolleeae]|eukprot:XP_023345615.1 hepatoma-derived growth factor-related protein 2-like [Eurytemora affinis]
MVKKFSVGALVFAKVRGFPPWPARITRITENGKYAVFFYGTYENATLKANEIFEFSKENQASFIPKNIHRKNYGKGIDELKYTPEIAPGVDQVTDDADPPLQSLDTPVDEKKSAPQPVVRKPLKLCDGTPVKRGSATPVTPGADSARIRGTKRSAEESETEGSLNSAPQTSSRSGRVIKQKRFSDETRGDGDVKHQTDQTKPRWESHEQKLTWLLSTARNARKLKEFVELGEFIPAELVDSLKSKSELTTEETQQLKRVAELALRREKVSWLLREKEMVETNIAIRKALHSKNPDTDECVRCLQNFLHLDLDKLMIIKQPAVVDTMRKLVRYQGSKEEMSLPDKEKERMKRNIKNIQIMGETIYKKLQMLFKYKESPSNQFQAFIQQEVNRFAEATKSLPQSQALALTEYP